MLTDPNNASIDTLLLSKKMQEAFAEINARLPDAILPMTAPYPPTLTIAECKITRAILYTVGRPEHVETDYRDALKFIDDVRAGRASLGLISTGASVFPSQSTVSVAAPAITFTDEVLATL